MEIEYIREFIVLVQEMNFTSASKRLFLTQPALSRHIASLEEHLGTRLLERTTHSVTLTPAGKEALGHFTRIIQEYDATLRQVELLRGGYRAELCVALPAHAVNLYVQPILDYARSQFPDVRLSCLSCNSEEMSRRTISGEIDAGLALRFSAESDANLRAMRICDVPLLLLVGENDRFSDERRISVQSLRGRRLVYPVWPASYRNHVRRLLAAHEVASEADVFVDQAVSIVDVVERESACAIVVPQMTHYQMPRTKVLKFEEQDMTAELCWVYSVLNDNKELARFLDGSIEVIRAASAS